MATISSSRPVPPGPQPIPVASTTQSYQYTCNSCQVAFRNNELQRTHMRGDWQYVKKESQFVNQTLKFASRYNLKRRVASLPPLSSEVFAEKVLTAQATSTAAAAKASFEKQCAACQKTYYSENAYQNHLGSQKHRLRLAALRNRDPSKDPETDSVISSAISLGEPINQTPTETIDPEAEAEFSKVVDGIKEAKLDDQDTISRRPSRPHHSANEERLDHPLSENLTAESTPTVSRPRSPTQAAATAPLKQCLFCNYESPSFRLSVMHMTKFHGLFIPEQPYLVDCEGLVAYLYSKIFEHHECLYCHKIKGSAESIQTHMRDKGHCMIAYTTEAEMIEVGQFYDFRSSYSDPESDLGEEDDDDDEDEDIKGTEGGVKLGGKKCLKTVICDASGDKEVRDGEDENAEGWETDSSASSIASEDLTAIPIEDRSEAFKRLPLSRHHSHTDPRHHHQVDGYHSHAHSHRAVFLDEYELHMPSGRVAGHRSLSRYYRQNLHNYPSANERIERHQRMIENARSGDSDEDMDDKSSGEGDENEHAGDARGRQVAARANGSLSMVGVTDAKKRELRAVEKRDRKRAQRAQKQYDWGINKRANNQKHFRDPLLQ
ncbi:MAG: hypothetical protein L6R41_000833 [Letrouitia leprolyta]|nr:MAG: hypothetical protein L6R41_000833 [Letrouitia leprolyta]